MMEDIVQEMFGAPFGAENDVDVIESFKNLDMWR